MALREADSRYVKDLTTLSHSGGFFVVTFELVVGRNVTFALL